MHGRGGNDDIRAVFAIASRASVGLPKVSIRPAPMAASIARISEKHGPAIVDDGNDEGVEMAAKSAMVEHCSTPAPVRLALHR